jgi:hypothetical protein
MKHGGNHLIVRTALIEKGYVDDGALCHCVRELTQGCVLQAGAAALQSRVLRVAESARRRDGGQVVGHDARRESGLGLGRSVGWLGGLGRWFPPGHSRGYHVSAVHLVRRTRSR